MALGSFQTRTLVRLSPYFRNTGFATTVFGTIYFFLNVKVSTHYKHQLKLNVRMKFFSTYFVVVVVLFVVTKCLHAIPKSKLTDSSQYAK